MVAQKARGEIQIRVPAHTEEQDVNMVRHEAISRAPAAVAVGGVDEDFTETGVESRVQPAGCAVFDAEGPMHCGMALVGLAREAWEVLAVVGTSREAAL